VFNTGRTPAAGQNVLRKPSLKKPLAESTSAGLSAENWQSF